MHVIVFARLVSRNKCEDAEPKTRLHKIFLRSAGEAMDRMNYAQHSPYLSLHIHKEDRCEWCCQ